MKIAIGALIGFGAALTLSQAASAQTMYMVNLSGAAEKPTAGDPDGGGMAHIHLDTAKNQVCYDVSVTGIAPATMAHIHKAGADAAGPVVLPMQAPGADGKVSACADADPALIKDLADNPAAYYVNVHNAEFKAGAVRGQLAN